MKKSKIKFAHVPAKRIAEEWQYVEFTEWGDYKFEFHIERLPNHKGWVLSDGMRGEVLWTGSSLRICKHIVKVLINDPLQRDWVNLIILRLFERKQK